MLTHAILAAILAVAGNPIAPDATRQCGLIEVNHLHTPDGEPLLVQMLIWDWDYSEDRFRVRAWVKAPPHPIPIRRGNEHQIAVRDVQGRRIVLTSPLWRESWTIEDPEAEERHCDFRRKLRWK